MYFYQVALYTITFSPSPPTQNGASSPPAPFRLATIFCSHVEAEVDHVAVLDHVLLALGPQQALLLGGGHTAAAGHHLVEVDGLRPDEAPLDVGVDLAGGLSYIIRIWLAQNGNQINNDSYATQSERQQIQDGQAISFLVKFVCPEKAEK